MFLFEKPWLTTGAENIEETRDREAIRLSQTKGGLKWLISAMSVLFFLMIVAYFVRMKVTDWLPLAEPWLLWINTGFLILSSVIMHFAVKAARQDRFARVKVLFLCAGLFTWAFLIGQYWGWQLLKDSGQFISSNPANSFFYMITALHGLHLLGGLGVWVHGMLKMKDDCEMVEIRSSVELCATYWHFLLIIWIILYSLLLST